MQIDQTRRPAALLPIQEGLRTVANSYRSGGVTSPEHMALSSAISKGRRAVIDTYGADVHLLAQHLGKEQEVPGLAELVVHAAIPRHIGDMNAASQNPELLAVRARALRGFLCGIIDIAVGEPYTLSYCHNDTGATERSVFGQIQDSPLEMYDNARQSRDGLVLRTPLIRPESNGFFKNGLIPVSAMAADTEDGILRLELSAGTEVITSALKGRVAELRQATTPEEAFAAAVDVVKNAAANKVALTEVASDAELQNMTAVIGSQFIEAAFGTVDFDNSALAMTQLHELQAECLAVTREGITRRLARIDPQQHVQQLHDYCMTSARKLLLIDSLPQVKDEQSCMDTVHRARQTFEGSDLTVYVQEAYSHLGSAV